MDSLTELLT